MKQLTSHLFLFFNLFFLPLFSDNQTEDLSPIFSQDSLPFRIRIEQEDFSLSQGLQSYFFGVHNGRWLLLGGRTNGLHGFDNNDDNFPAREQNVVAYVVDPIGKRVVAAKSLHHQTSGLTQQQIDQLSVTAGQHFQHRETLYITGGYGIDTATGSFNTKDTLTAIHIPGFMRWVTSSSKRESAARHIRQTSHPWLQVTGGYMEKVDSHLSCLLILGQNFPTFYLDSSNGDYTNQIRRFQIIDTGEKLFVQPRFASDPLPSYRRRDLNVTPIIAGNKQSFVALSGVFTPSTGVWTVPIVIDLDGTSSMADPSLPNTFKQGMNNYDCPTIPLYSKKSDEMYIILLGGITYGFFVGENFLTDDEIPFTNQVTTIRIDKQGNFQQHLMDAEYPLIFSGIDRLLFGAEGEFIPAHGISLYPNGVLRLDKIRRPTLIGHIVGGIMSTRPNTNTMTDSAASHYIFKVILEPY